MGNFINWARALGTRIVCIVSFISTYFADRVLAHRRERWKTSMQLGQRTRPVYVGDHANVSSMIFQELQVSQPSKNAHESVGMAVVNKYEPSQFGSRRSLHGRLSHPLPSAPSYALSGRLSHLFCVTLA